MEDDGGIRGRFEATVRDLNSALDLDLPVDGSAVQADVERFRGAIEEYYLDRVGFTAESQRGAIRPTTLGVGKFHGTQYALLDFDLEGLPARSRVLDVDYRALFEVDPDHRAFLVVENDWLSGRLQNEAGVSLVFSPSDTRQRLDLTSSSVWSGLAAMIRLGVHHIWVGIDHIFFLIAILLPSVLRRRSAQWEAVEDFPSAFRQVIKVVTLFTLAHSVTLSLAALGLVQLPGRLVESIIALSIAVAALDVLLPVLRSRTWVVFAFGLFHGFGFASVLAEMGIGRKFMAWSLLGFNLGVEIGQATIVAAIFPVLYLLRATPIYRPLIFRPVAGVLILSAMYWFVERAFAVDVPTVGLIYRLFG